MVNRASFELQVQEALGHLYDLPFLQRSPLLSYLDRQTSRGAGGKALHGALLDAIEQLKPPPEVSPEAIIWRIYRTLVLRYVRSLNAATAARELGLSTRQAQRIHGIAVATLATALGEGWGLGETEPGGGPPIAEASDRPAPKGEGATVSASSPDLDDELAAILAGDLGEFEPFRTTLQGAIETVGPVLRQREISIDPRIDDELSHWIAPHGLTRQALVQILLGASTFARAGTLQIVAKRQASGAHLAVSAHFADPTRLAHLDRAAIEERVAIARRLLDAVGGNLSIHPTEACIEVDFHLEISPTVLFVEDNPQVVQLFRRYLVGTIYQFLHAPDSDSVLDLAVREQPSIVSLDVMMPRRDGWELLQALKIDPRTKDIPVIVCSVLRDHELALALGAAEFLAKPVSQSALLGALNRNAARLLRPEIRTTESG